MNPVDGVIRLSNRDHQKRMQWFWMIQIHCFGCLWVGFSLISFSATCVPIFGMPVHHQATLERAVGTGGSKDSWSNTYNFFLLIFWWIISLRSDKILFCLGLFLIIKHSQCSPVKREVKGLQGSEWLESRKIPPDAMDTKQSTGTFTHFSSAL